MIDLDKYTEVGSDWTTINMKRKDPPTPSRSERVWSYLVWGIGVFMMAAFAAVAVVLLWQTAEGELPLWWAVVALWFGGSFVALLRAAFFPNWRWRRYGKAVFLREWRWRP